MSEEVIGAIDCGTTSARFMIFDSRANVLASHQLELETAYPKSGWMQQDPLHLVEVCQTCITEAVKKFEQGGRSRKDIKGLGVTNQRETTIAWSRKTGKPLYPAIVWPDTRNTATVRKLEKSSEGGTDALKAKTGLPLSTYFAACKLKWMFENVPEVKTAHDEGELMAGTVDTWLLWNLTGGLDGGLFYTDVTNASRTMLMDVRTLEWDDELLKFFGFDKRCFAKIVSNSEVYGELVDGALKGFPIAGMVGDQQAALIGQKCYEAGMAKNTYGTGCFMLYNTGTEPVPSTHGLLTTVAYKAGKEAKQRYALEGSIAVGGSSIKWLRDQLKLIKEASEVGELADEVEDAGGIYFVTGFSGLFAPYWDDLATGLLIGVTAYTDRRHICRATIEATCYQTRAILEAMQADSGHDLAGLRVDGGMTNSDQAMQIQADIVGIEVERPDMRESTALGSAIMAAQALGLFGWDVDKPETLKEVSTAGQKVFSPKWKKEERERRYRGWQRAVERAKGWYEDADVQADQPNEE